MTSDLIVDHTKHKYKIKINLFSDREFRMITSHEPTLTEYLIGICHKTKCKRTWNTRIGEQRHQEGKSVHIFKIAIYNQNPKQFLLVSCSAPCPECRFNADYLRLVPQDRGDPGSGTEISGVLSQAVLSECIS